MLTSHGVVVESPCVREAEEEGNIVESRGEAARQNWRKIEEEGEEAGLNLVSTQTVERAGEVDLVPFGPDSKIPE